MSRYISEYIVKKLAPRLFAILNCYRNFKFFGYDESKKALPEQFIIISNHQSLLDIPAYMNFLRDKELRFVAKDNLARHIP
ncbi:MAG: 1-acyl-sn-glycerol-3-phosphate acyltransferase, partial [Treponema sp.]